METAIKAFYAMRPYYSLEHIRTIAEFASANAIPFCEQCADWHEANEEHSLTEGFMAVNMPDVPPGIALVNYPEFTTMEWEATH